MLCTPRTLSDLRKMRCLGVRVDYGLNSRSNACLTSAHTLTRARIPSLYVIYAILDLLIQGLDAMVKHAVFQGVVSEVE